MKWNEEIVARRHFCCRDRKERCAPGVCVDVNKLFEMRKGRKRKMRQLKCVEALFHVFSCTCWFSMQLIRRELLQDVTVYYKVASSTFERFWSKQRAWTGCWEMESCKTRDYLCCLYWSAAVPGMVLVGRPFCYWKSSRCSWNDPEVCKKFKDQDNMQSVYTMWYEFLTWWDTVSYPLATPEGAHWVISWKICALSDKKEIRSQDALFINVAYGRTGEAGIHSGSSS